MGNTARRQVISVASVGRRRLVGCDVATQVWLAVSEDPGAKLSGRYFYRKRAQPAHAASSDVTVQDAFLAACEQLTGARLESAVTK